MSNPCINRWGVNLFWYKFWYSDKIYSSIVKQDSVLENLINSYLHFGLNVVYNPFANSYWYNKKSIITLDANLYSRKIVVKNSILGIESIYTRRLKTEDVYPMRVWVLRFSGWLIINLYWFKPWKNKKSTMLRLGVKSWDYMQVEKTQKFTLVNRIKTLLSRQLITRLLSNQRYMF